MIPQKMSPVNTLYLHKSRARRTTPKIPFFSAWAYTDECGLSAGFRLVVRERSAKVLYSEGVPVPCQWAEAHVGGLLGGDDFGSASKSA